jgi:hypothetical protein
VITTPTPEQANHIRRRAMRKNERPVPQSLDTLDASELYLRGEMSPKEYDKLVRSRIAKYNSAVQSLAKDHSVKKPPFSAVLSRIRALVDQYIQHQHALVL